MDQSSGFDQIPQTIGRYEVQGAIGFGAMGAVYKAFDPRIKRLLAIKTIRLDIPRQSPEYKTFIERFYHEARISGTLSHPHIVTLFDIGEERGVPYLAMEYVEGETLSALIDRGERFAPEKVVALVSQIASAVDYAHTKGVVHRDVKPSNLILYEGERVKVTDFGIAKMVDTDMTQQGQMLGTPSYMSPEQAMGEKVDGRTDIFSLGVCAFEMLSGEQPFPGANVTAILYKLVHADPIEPAGLELRGLVPQKWHEVFRKVLAKKPDDRYQTAADFVRDLEYCLGSWFGAAMADETMAAAPAVAPATDATTTLRQSPADTTVPARPSPAAQVDVDATRDARLTLPPQPIVAPPAAAPTPGETVMLASAGATGATVLLAGAPAPGAAPPAVAPPPGATVMLPGVPPSAGATLLVPGAPPHDAPPAGATVLMAPPPSGPTVAMPTPASLDTVRAAIPSGMAADPTVRAARPAPQEPTDRMPQGAPPLRAPATPARASAPAAARPASSGGRAGLVLGVVGLVLLVGVALGAYLLWPRGTTTPAEASPAPSAPLAATPAPRASAAPLLGSLSVDSEPQGASVSLNGEPRGVTPLRLDELALGEYTLLVERAGYQPFTQSVALSAASRTAELRPVLVRAAAPPRVQATLTVLSTPFGAAVTLDGTPVGQTPLTNLRLNPGRHQLELTKAGYKPWSRALEVKAGEPVKVDAPLEALPVAPTPPPVATPDPTRVYANTAGEVDTLARKITGADVVYPRAARRLRSGESVSVVVSVVIDEEGRVAEIEVLESAGRQVDEAVVSTIKTWTFSPAVKKGVKVKVRQPFKRTFRAG